jgi:hypothetical protein
MRFGTDPTKVRPKPFPNRLSELLDAISNGLLAFHVLDHCDDGSNKPRKTTAS